MKRIVLKIDGIFLMVMGGLAGISDLVSYFAGKGPFGQAYFQNSIAIGGFEAHCLAIIAGLILTVKSKSPDAIFFTKVAIAIHTMLGVSNLVWFQIFVDTETIPMGIITTLAHFTFVFLNSIATINTVASPVLIEPDHNTTFSQNEN